MNKSFASMCKIANKYEDINTKFVSVCKLFLEQARFTAPFTKEIEFYMRIVPPYSTYFLEDRRELNEQGRLKAVKYLLTVSGIKPECYKWAGIPMVIKTKIQQQ